MVLEQKPARKQGAPNRCCHRTNPTVSASSSLIGYIEFYSLWRIVLYLSESYTGDDFTHVYAAEHDDICRQDEEGMQLAWQVADPDQATTLGKDPDFGYQRVALYAGLSHPAGDTGPSRKSVTVLNQSNSPLRT